MSQSLLSPVVSTAVAGALLLGCGSTETPPSEAAPAPVPAERAELEPGAAESTAPDSIDPDQLKAGLEIIKPRVIRKIEALAPITVQPSSRYFMHPGEDKNASIEINTKGLASLVLSPVIEDLSKSEDCAPPTAGVVEFVWALDGNEPKRVNVDRNYRSTIAVDIGTASVLWLEVSKGNGTPLCDWFSVGFLDVKTR